MRPIYLSLLIGLLTLVGDHLPAQTLDSALAYYPLSDGNQWEFGYHGIIKAPPYLYYFTLTIEGDTLMPNGKQYKVQVRRQPGTVSYKYLRMDSLGANVYLYTPGAPRGEYIFDSLLAKPTDGFSVGWGRSCLAVYRDTIAGTPTVVKWFTTDAGDYDDALAYGIGPVGYGELGGDGFPYSSDFVYANVDGHQYGTPVSVRNAGPILPESYVLSQNYPNPFNPTTTIQYALPLRSHVTLSIYNTVGQLVTTLVNGEDLPGFHEVKFDGRGLASGVYFYRLRTGESIMTKRMMLVR